MPLSIIILAAGQGTRMKSARPKVIHPVAGRPMLQHVVDTSLLLKPEQVIVVVGHQSEQVRQLINGEGLIFVEQTQQLGTGHAVVQCLGELNEGNDVLVLYGDVPLIKAETLQGLLSDTEGSSIGILSFVPVNAHGYGRILRDEDDSVKAIVEEKDASSEEKNIRESNSGILFMNGANLHSLIEKLDDDNTQSEFYLTDVVRHAVNANLNVSATICASAEEVSGVNNQAQLAEVERIYARRQADKLMLEGVKLYDPDRIDVRGNLQVGTDVEIDVNCIFEGDVTLADNVRIGANCVIRNSKIGTGSIILPMTTIDEAITGSRVSIGPYARIRPGTECDDGVKIGNFVEIKKAKIGAGSKVNHLSYIGDTDMGSGVNIGAGTITCNYDGFNKFKTIIEDDVFVGSDTQLVAPVTIARGSTIGAGSTITRDTPAHKLTLSRPKQVTLESWKKPTRKK
ncbi:MAG: bifunctional UDP-N-acetylglucosamine diphosphorylase/glucosamine-1-phosphate N-acetyltransferase GlmU [Gammaproteobacteria bacterium]